MVTKQMRGDRLNLNIKTCKQPYGTAICGPCCVKMCMQHFGTKASLKIIKERCHCAKAGSLETSLVLAINQFGLQATWYVIPSGDIFFGKYATMPKTKVASVLGRRAKLTRDIIFKEAAELIEQGAVKFELPSREVIERELHEGRPWIVGCRYYLLTEQQERYGADVTHFVVIQGYNKKHFIINDPFWGVRKINKDLLLCAVYSCPGDVSAICVSNNRR